MRSGKCGRVSGLAGVSDDGHRCVGSIEVGVNQYLSGAGCLAAVPVHHDECFVDVENARPADEVTGRRALPDGERKPQETKRMIDRVRTFIGYREYPKYFIVSRYFMYKQALLEEAERLVQAHVIREKQDIFYLTFQQLHDVVRTNQVDDQLISQRKATFRTYQALTPPRVLTSDGGVIGGAYRRDDLPTGALIGLHGPQLPPVRRDQGSGDAGGA
jgi:phosphoenolpyruvate synthase/pyruvate phosphate dikinase